MCFLCHQNQMDLLHVPKPLLSSTGLAEFIQKTQSPHRQHLVEQKVKNVGLGIIVIIIIISIWQIQHGCHQQFKVSRIRSDQLVWHLNTWWALSEPDIFRSNFIGLAKRGCFSYKGLTSQHPRAPSALCVCITLSGEKGNLDLLLSPQRYHAEKEGTDAKILLSRFYILSLYCHFNAERLRLPEQVGG